MLKCLNVHGSVAIDSEPAKSSRKFLKNFKCGFSFLRKEDKLAALMRMRSALQTRFGV